MLRTAISVIVEVKYLVVLVPIEQNIDLQFTTLWGIVFSQRLDNSTIAIKDLMIMGSANYIHFIQ